MRELCLAEHPDIKEVCALGLGHAGNHEAFRSTEGGPVRIKSWPGEPVPELTTEQLHRAGAFGVAVPRKPKVGERWEKGSFPLPTVVEVVAAEGDSVTVKHGSKRPVTLQLAEFLGQGFARYEGFLALPQDEPSEPAAPQMPKVWERGSVKPVDERIDDAFERLLRVAKEDEDLDLVAVVGVIRALWMADAMIEGWRALAGVREMVEPTIDDGGTGSVTITTDGACLLCGEREPHRHSLAELKAHNAAREANDANHE